MNSLVLKLALLTFYFLFEISSINAQIKLDNIYYSEDGISYSIVLPINYNKNKKYPLAIGLHGLYSDGSRMVNPFSYYSRYMNIILVCPDGNFPDNPRNGVKWGYEKSEKYILDLVTLIKAKHKVYDDIFLFGFSQGGNQGLQTALSNTKVFRYFAGLSGGYTTLTEKQIRSASNVNILFISGDTGDGEVYTKREMDHRFQTLKKHNPHAIRKVYQGVRHEVIHEEAYYMFDWFFSVSRKNKINNLIKEDYYLTFNESAKAFEEARYEDSIKFAYSSISKNKIFAPSYSNLVISYFNIQDFINFKKYFFPMLELYSTFTFFDHVPVLNLFELLKLSDTSLLSKNKFLDFFLIKLNEYESKISTLYKGEIYLLIAELYIINRNPEYAKIAFNKAAYYYSNINAKDILYIDAQIKQKLQYITEYTNELDGSK